jgi:NAD(P)H-hydrate epimerase
LKEYLAGKESIALGPGLGQSDWAIDIWKRTMNYAMENNIHLVLDADGLNILADQGWDTPLPNAILTPHPGEAARLLETTVNDIQSDREAAVQKLSKKYQACVVLKGAGSLITAPNQPIFLNPTGNAGLATGGTGDVLTGIIAALLAQGLTPLQAAKSGGFLHGRAGDHAVAQIGKAGMTAMDVVDGLTCI